MNSLPVPGAVLRCGTGTAYFHENIKTYHPAPSAVGHLMRALPRRYFNSRFVSREEHSAVPDGSQPAGTLGVSHLPQVVSGSFKNTGVFGDDNRLAPDGTSGSTREGSKIQTGHQVVPALRLPASLDTAPARWRDRQNSSDGPSRVSGEVVVSAPPLRQELSARSQRHSPTHAREQDGTAVGGSNQA